MCRNDHVTVGIFLSDWNAARMMDRIASKQICHDSLQRNNLRFKQKSRAIAMLALHMYNFDQKRASAMLRDHMVVATNGSVRLFRNGGPVAQSS